MSTAGILAGLGIFLLGLVVGGGVIWFVSNFIRRMRSKQTDNVTHTALKFRWMYLVIPFILLLFSIVIVLVAYPSLPESVAYRFSTGGAPRSYFPRATFVSLMLGAQLFITVLVGGLAVGIVQFGNSLLKKSALQFNAQGVTWLMSNMLVLPQVILAFILLDSSYYALQLEHLMTPWLFSLIAVACGSVILLFVFIQTFTQIRVKQLKE